LHELVEEQAALRRVATLVAQGMPPEEVFASVTEEVVRVLPVDLARIGRYEPDGTVTFVAASGRMGAAFAAGASGRSGVAVREGGFPSALGTPITVEGRPWGVMDVGSRRREPMPADIRARLACFTELLATAVANAESGADLARLAAEHAALRRVATLVARGAPPEEVFAAVTEEVGQLLPVDYAALGRYGSNHSLSYVASWSRTGNPFPRIGTRVALGGKNIGTLVFETGRPARIDCYADASGPLVGAIRMQGVRSAVGTPIIVEGSPWGVMVVASILEQPLPSDIEAHLASFTELVAAAIANAESCAALAASRSRIVAAADETRRRIERDLHDGTQQHLVSLMLELQAVEATKSSEVGELRAQLARTARGLGGALEELQEISRGIHPAILAEGGLNGALRALARRSAVPVDLELRTERRQPEHVEVAAYYVVSEALTNAAKHAHASLVHVELEAGDAVVRLAVRDDGVGGADPAQGSGLVGLSDRVEALGGTLHVTSPAGSGTTLLIELPVEARSPER
jgi:signal transduction histidine kinase